MEKDIKCYEYNYKSYDGINNYLIEDLKNRIEKLMNIYNRNKIMIVCIGSTKAEFDCFGPLTGSKLVDQINNPNVSIYGTQTNPIHAANIRSFLLEHFDEMNNSLTIVIDATVARVHPLGTIIVSNSGIHPGEGVGKKLPYIGDLSFKILTIGPKKEENPCTLISNLANFFKKISFKNNHIDLYYNEFYDILNSEDISTISNMVSNCLATVLEKIFDNEIDKRICLNKTTN